MRSQATAYPWTKGPLAVQQLFGSANALVSTTPFWGCEKDSRSTLTEAAATATAVSLLISISTIYRLVLYLKVCVPTFNLENGKSAEEMTMAEEPNSAENEEPMDSDKDDSDEFSDSDSSSGGYDSSDLSCTEYDRISDETAANLNELEDCFVKLREAMKKEKLSSINSQIIQLLEEKSPDYLQPLEELIESRDERIQIAGVVRDYRIRNTKLNFEADLSITEQDFQNEKVLLKDRIRQSINEKIKKLNEDRHKADNDYISESSFSKRSRKYSGTYQDEFSEKRRKPVTVSGPYIVYMLKDEEIIEDLKYINCFSRPLRSYNISY